MKVHGNTPTNQLRSIHAANKPRSSGSTANTQGESVKFSSGARQLLASRGPEVPDEARIARIRTSIEDGTFRVDADLIAEKMLEEEA